MAEEAINCHKHCEQAREDERRSIGEFILERVIISPYPLTTEHDRLCLLQDIANILKSGKSLASLKAGERREERG